MTETIFLIDGMYLLFSSFYSNRNMRTLKGEPTGAIYGFVTAGASLNWTLGPLAFGKPEQATAYTSIHTMLTGMRGIIAPWIGTYLVFAIGLYSTFVLAAAAMILSGILLFGLHIRTRNSWRPSHI